MSWFKLYFWPPIFWGPGNLSPGCTPESFFGWRNGCLHCKQSACDWLNSYNIGHPSFGVLASPGCIPESFFGWASVCVCFSTANRFPVTGWSYFVLSATSNVLAACLCECMIWIYHLSSLVSAGVSVPAEARKTLETVVFGDLLWCVVFNCSFILHV